MIVDVTRGDLVESTHEVAACVADSAGRIVHATGDVERRVFLRSSAKPFIAAAIVASGAADRYGFDARELAVMSASHAAEPFHLEAVRGILAKAGLDAGALRCGTPDGANSALENNCSGKHAGILAMCVHLGFETETYLAPEHPAQRRILDLCARLAGEDVAEFVVAVDGCGIPVYATSLRRAAQSFARFATLDEVSDGDARALERVRRAMQAEPPYVAGTGRFDSALIAVTGGRIVGKIGAEGVHGDAMLRDGLGAALKVRDGARRAVAPAVVALLGEVGAFEPGETSLLAGFGAPTLRNVAGAAVGRVRAVPDTIRT